MATDATDEAASLIGRLNSEREHYRQLYMEAVRGHSGEDAAKLGELRELCRQLLIIIGEEPDRDGLKKTPDRFARWWLEFSTYKPGDISTSFESVVVDQMVAVTGIRVWSLCEHHLLPFFCDISIAYLTKSRVLGLSKFARIAHKHAHRLQVQERLVEDIASEVETLCGTENVGVLGRGEHLCMTMRGIKTPAQMVSSVMRGAFRQSEVRAEFLSLAKW